MKINSNVRVDNLSNRKKISLSASQQPVHTKTKTLLFMVVCFIKYKIMQMIELKLS